MGGRADSLGPRQRSLRGAARPIRACGGPDASAGPRDLRSWSGCAVRRRTTAGCASRCATATPWMPVVRRRCTTKFRGSRSRAALDDRAKAALRYADALIWSPAHLAVDDAVEVRSRFSEAEAVELTFDIMRNASNKIAVSLGADAARVESRDRAVSDRYQWSDGVQLTVGMASRAVFAVGAGGAGGRCLGRLFWERRKIWRAGQ